MSVPDLVELIKAIGTAVSVIVGAVTIGYARVAAKRSKAAAQQTATTRFVGGQLHVRGAAESAEDALNKIDQLKDYVDALKAETVALRTDIGKTRGFGKRRLPTQATPTVKETPDDEHDPW